MSIEEKIHDTRQRLAFDCASQAKKSERANSNPFFIRRVHALVLNGVCDTYEEAAGHADK